MIESLLAIAAGAFKIADELARGKIDEETAMKRARSLVDHLPHTGDGSLKADVDAEKAAARGERR
jgi:hypothetical protein